MPIHEERMAVISTCHLPEDEANTLAEAIKEGFVNGMYRDEGFLVHTRESCKGFDAMGYILGYMRAKGVDWVLFDRDAERLTHLPTYDW